MHMEKEELSPTFKRVFKVIKERELEKAEKKGLEEGIEKGIERGIERGIEQGIEKEKEHFATNLIKENFENEKIAQLTGLPLERVIELRKSL